MKERGILFSAPMVRALLAGTKTQTRRIINPQPRRVDWHVDRSLTVANRAGNAQVLPVEVPNGWQWRQLYVADGHEHECGGDFASSLAWHCPYGYPHDQYRPRLWVRETWRTVGSLDVIRPIALHESVPIHYDSDDSNRGRFHEPVGRVRPGIHMPRWASRITLELIDVRAQQLHYISEDDARAEGVERDTAPCDHTRQSCEDIGCMGPTFRSTFAELWMQINGEESWDANPWVWALTFNRVEVANG